MKVYTRTGDKGTTSLVGGKRVEKDNVRLQAYGTVDELNSWIGLVKATVTTTADAAKQLSDSQLSLLEWIQNKLFDLGSLLATEPESKWQPKGLKETDTERLERAIDQMEALLPEHHQFVLPGGNVASAQAQIARTVARRAERQMITLAGEAPVQEEALRFVNRLSDYLFVLARTLNHTAGTPEVFWDQNA